MATAKKNGLGKGLDSLITNKVNTAKTTTATTKPTVKKDEKVVEGILVNINKVEPNREQPRKNFDKEALEELADSIKQYGLIQPIVVQKKDDYYEIIAGERRWRAAKIAKLKEIMGTKVNINHKKGGKGKIEIEYYSQDELERLLELFDSIQNQ